MSESTTTIPTEEYNRLRRQARPIHSRLLTAQDKVKDGTLVLRGNHLQFVPTPMYVENDHITSDGLLKFTKPIKFAQGPFQRDVKCKHCGSDFWLIDHTDATCCGMCGFYAME